MNEMSTEFQPVAASGSETPSAARPGVMLIFDGYYSNRENIVASYVNRVIEQMPYCKQFSVFTKGNYHGAKLESKRVKIRHFSSFERAEAEKRLGRKLKRMLVRLVMSSPSANYWYSSISKYEETIIQQLFDAPKYQAVIVFSQSVELILRVTRYAHLFSGAETPHVIGVTPQLKADADTIRDLKWLGARLLIDGEIMPHREESIKPVGSSVTGTVSFSKAWQRVTSFLANMHEQESGDSEIDEQKHDVDAEETKPEKPNKKKGGKTAAALRSRDTVKVSEPLVRPAPRNLLPTSIAGAEYSFFDDVTFPYRVNISGRHVEWSDVVGPARPLPKRVRDIVLFVRPDWASCGSGTYFESLARHFRETDTLMLDIALYPYKVPFWDKERRSKFEEEQKFIRAAAAFSLRQSDGWLQNLRAFSNYFSYRPKSAINHIMLSYSYVARPQLMNDVIRHASITKIYINHYFSYLFAKPYMEGRPFLLDTHDIQSINAVHHMYRNASSGRLDNFSTLIEEEMRILRKADRLSFVSLSEIEIAKKYLDGDRIINFIAVPNVVPLPARKLGKRVKVLLVASRNPANEHNIDWFLGNVWPLIRRQHISAGISSIELSVCGSIKSYVGDKTYHGVTFHGIVDDLRRYYDEAHLVVLPVVSGGGAAMKAIEALLYERPVVGTKHAYRGLPDTIGEETGYYNTPKQLADAVINAVRNPANYQLFSRKTRAASQILRQQDYFARLDKALEDVRIAD